MTDDFEEMTRLSEAQLDYGVKYISAMANDEDLPGASPLTPGEEDQLWAAVANTMARLSNAKMQRRFARRRDPTGDRCIHGNRADECLTMSCVHYVGFKEV